MSKKIPRGAVKGAIKVVKVYKEASKSNQEDALDYWEDMDMGLLRFFRAAHKWYPGKVIKIRRLS